VTIYGRAAVVEQGDVLSTNSRLSIDATAWGTPIQLALAICNHRK
jgi:hypothetical protein